MHVLYTQQGMPFSQKGRQVEQWDTSPNTLITYRKTIGLLVIEDKNGMSWQYVLRSISLVG
jgi:hypothetical protein